MIQAEAEIEIRARVARSFMGDSYLRIADGGFPQVSTRRTSALAEEFDVALV